MKEKLRIAVPGKKEALKNYIDALEHTGAEAVILEKAGICAEEYEGLLLPGGADLDPARYGQDNRASRNLDPELDELQLRVTDCFLKRGLPVLGICRGLQLLNVIFGGTLIQDLPGAYRHSKNGQPEDKIHGNFAVRGSWLEQLYGECFVTNSSHHQGIDHLGDGLCVCQYSDDAAVAAGGVPVIEGICHQSLPVYAVQWHPERMCFAYERADTVDGSRVFGYFLESCRRKKDRVPAQRQDG